MSQVYKNCASIVAHLPEVDLELRKVARELEGKARANLAMHRDERRAHHVLVTKGKTDYFVTLEGTAAWPVEHNLRILRNAVGGTG
jgi:hypothetical protein